MFMGKDQFVSTMLASDASGKTIRSSSGPGDATRHQGPPAGRSRARPDQCGSMPIAGEAALQISSQTLSQPLSLAASLAISPGPDRRVDSSTFRGWVRFEEVHPGLAAAAYDLTSLTSNTIIQTVGRSATVGIVLEGQSGELEIEGCRPFAAQYRRAQILGLGEATVCTRRFRPGQRCLIVGFVIQPTFLERFGKATDGTGLDRIGELMQPGFRTTTLARSAKLIDMARSAANSPYTGTLDRLFQESITVQMLFEALNGIRSERALAAKLGRRCLKAVMTAREILDAALVSPPKTLDLARQAGVNINVLQVGFKTAFGTTIFGYVRRQRLVLARLLIHEHGLGAAEAGYRVGFTSPSAFSAAFRREFGCTPSSGTVPADRARGEDKFLPAA